MYTIFWRETGCEDGIRTGLIHDRAPWRTSVLAALDIQVTIVSYRTREPYRERENR
jgi:hypothetical protein